MKFNAQQLCWVLYVTGIVWIGLFPAVNISSGELKARALYVDENALMVMNVRNLPKQASLSTSAISANSSLGDFCGYLSEGSLDSCAVVHFKSGINQYFHSMIKIRVNAERNPTSLETLIIAIPFVDCHQLAVLVMAKHLIAEVKEFEWLSKRIVIYLIPCSAPRCKSRNINIADVLRFQLALPRQALILDLASSKSERLCGRGSIRWDTAVVHTTGLNGMLPNMDMLSSAFVMNIKFSLHPELDYSQTATPLTRIIDYLFKYTDDGYRYRLAGLFMSFQDLISGPDGLHGQFLIHNIDAITLRPREMNRRRREIKDIAAVDNDWLQITTNFIQIWSNLHEELHHSQFFYLLMGTRHFVGITEFGSTLLLVCAPLVALFVRLSRCQNMKTLRAARGTFAGDHWLWVATILVVVPLMGLVHLAVHSMQPACAGPTASSPLSSQVCTTAGCLPGREGIDHRMGLMQESAIGFSFGAGARRDRDGVGVEVWRCWDGAERLRRQAAEAAHARGMVLLEHRAGWLEAQAQSVVDAAMCLDAALNKGAQHTQGARAARDSDSNPSTTSGSQSVRSQMMDLLLRRCLDAWKLLLCLTWEDLWMSLVQGLFVLCAIAVSIRTIMCRPRSGRLHPSTDTVHDNGVDLGTETGLPREREKSLSVAIRDADVQLSEGIAEGYWAMMCLCAVAALGALGATNFALALPIGVVIVPLICACGSMACLISPSPSPKHRDAHSAASGANALWAARPVLSSALLSALICAATSPLGVLWVLRRLGGLEMASALARDWAEMGSFAFPALFLSTGAISLGALRLLLHLLVHRFLTQESDL